jgi:hypothetical protein
MQKIIAIVICAFSFSAYAQSINNNKGATPVEVENGPNNPVPVVVENPQSEIAVTGEVSVSNVPNVTVANIEASPIPARSVVKRIPVLCVFQQFSAVDLKEALACVTPTGMAVSPIPSGYFLAITDIIATSQLPTGSVGQALVSVSSRAGGVQFGAGVPMILKPGETQSLHYQTPHQVLPVGRTPTASVAINFGDVFPVDVNITGYLVETGDLGRE